MSFRGGGNHVHKKTCNESSRNTLAYAILIFSGTAITLLALTAIVVDTAHTLTILNVVLPVVASWVGTILAFYFGRENFEAANERVQELVERLTPKQSLIMARLLGLKFSGAVYHGIS